MREHSAPGRPRQFEPKETLAKIMAVFWEKGYEGASLSDLMEATGLKKGSLYAAFGDKRSMYLRSLAAYEAEAVQGAVTMLTGGCAPAERIARFLTAPIEAAWDRGDFRGCFLCNASTDRAAMDAEVAKSVRTAFERMARALEQALAEIDPDRPARGRALAILSVYSGLRGLARAGMAREALEKARNEAIAGLVDP